MKYRIMLSLLLVVSHGVMAQSTLPIDFEYPLSSRQKGVEEIVQESDVRWKTIYRFDKNGFLIEKNNRFIGAKETNDTYEYANVGDTMLVIKATDIMKPGEEARVYIHRYYSELFDVQYKRFETSVEGTNEILVVGTDLVYRDGRLEEYVRNGDTIRYSYNKKGLVAKREKLSSGNCEATEYRYDVLGRLTDKVTTNTTSGNGADLSDREYHIRYDDFDKKGNWTKSYLIKPRQKEPQLLFKRKIKYRK